MANNRSDIRAALKLMLSGQTSAGTNIFVERPVRWRSKLPAILIYTPEESATPENLQGSRYYRTLTLNIEAQVELTDEVEDSVDSLLAEIEDIIIADKSLMGSVISSQLTNSAIRVDNNGETDIGVGVLTYECKYIS